MVDLDKDWVKLHRNLLVNDLWRSEPFTKGQAWVDLLLLANFSDGFFFNRGIRVDVKRGQVGMSELQLSLRWRWSRTKVKSFFLLLEKEQQIVQHRNNVNSLITIVNYDLYQTKNQQKEHTECSRSATEVQQKSTIKKDKKKEEGKETNTEGKKHFAPNVLLKEVDHQKLVEKHGQEFVDACIEKLDSYKEAKGKRYASDYGAIRSWVVDEVAKNPPQVKAASCGQTEEELRAKGLI